VVLEGRHKWCSHIVLSYKQYSQPRGMEGPPRAPPPQASAATTAWNWHARSAHSLLKKLAWARLLRPGSPHHTHIVHSSSTRQPGRLHEPHIVAEIPATPRAGPELTSDSRRRGWRPRASHDHAPSIAQACTSNTSSTTIRPCKGEPSTSLPTLCALTVRATPPESPRTSHRRW
jgi:hypothetical protein